MGRAPDAPHPLDPPLNLFRILMSIECPSNRGDKRSIVISVYPSPDMDGSVYTAAGLVNDPITAILDVFSKYDIYGPQMEKIRIIKI